MRIERVSDGARDEVTAELERALLSDLGATQVQDVNATIVLEMRDRGVLMGGMSGATSYGWLLIKILWVSEAQRARGLGAALLARAEAEARAFGCRWAWLDTSSDAARGFYVRQGYEIFGTLGNDGVGPCPTHQRWFMRKDLAAVSLAEAGPGA